jgi:hypothetical protein
MLHVEALERATADLAMRRLLMTTAAYRAALASRVAELKRSALASSTATGHTVMRCSETSEKYASGMPRQGRFGPDADRNGHSLPSCGNGGTE